MPSKKLLIPISIVLAGLILLGIFLYTDNESNLVGSYELPPVDQVRGQSDVFLVSESDFGRISRGHPFLGSNSNCPHEGAHINYTDQGAPYQSEILTPVDGVITSIRDCFTIENYQFAHDIFEVGITFAREDGQDYELLYSIEPFISDVCEQTPDYYQQFIRVDLGQRVRAGDVVAIMPKQDSRGDSAHIHFNVIRGGQDQICPDLFSQQVLNKFSQHFGFENCQGEEFPATMCFQVGEGEELR